MTPEDFFCTRDVMEDGYDGWDSNTGKPGLGLFGNAIQVWSSQNWKSRPTVASAAATFNCTAQEIIDAVEAHHWMYLEGPSDDPGRMTIEHEGE